MDLDVDRLVESHFVEVRVEELGAHRVDLVVLQDHFALLTVEFEVDERVLGGSGLEDHGEFARRDAHRDVFLAGRVDDGGDAAPGTEALGFILAARFAGFCRNNDV